ncbi:uncharacterized protein (DUF433 family) [Actinoplanes tereljensis]|uniref:Putative antitoxin VapB45-like DNA-binding HTH domain-containing protein n=1 Tax=Paractinoplanes tereljensis TaxID=571912 RepID=A0A919NUN5_9ACTN|nr:DUF433 domain-containing protein [Actinoplanes tereljensis]GIF25028.1 hypothetical protein Ate02nite_77580 [Actinoplanes tereljensis]
MASVLDREMYSEAMAARLLAVPQSTLHYWLEGGTRRGVAYKPIIRPEPRGQRVVTWAEFVEAGWLSEYRNRNVPMAELRKFIDELREQFGVPYPLADRRPLVSGRSLVYDAQTSAQLGAEFYLVSVINGQAMLTLPGEAFIQRVEWDGDVAVAYRPDPNPRSPVRIDPDVRFGKPAIKGISTEVIWEHDDAGEDVESIADDYRLEVADVRWALSYENAQRAAA